MKTVAVEHIQAMRGGAQSHLMRASDGHLYVVKFVNNPQHQRVLANEWIAAKLAHALGLPVPPVAMIEVSPELIARSPELTLRVGTQRVPCATGWQFGSRVPSRLGPIFDCLPNPSLAEVENLSDFAGMLVFDQWTCNCDARQVIFCRTKPTGKLRAYMVDHGFCFNAGDWNFPDSPLRGLYSWHAVYAGLTHWRLFEMWLCKLESLTDKAILAAGHGIPEAWHGNREHLQHLIERLIFRRGRARGLLQASFELLPFMRGQGGAVQRQAA